MAKAIETLSIKLDFKDKGTQVIIDRVRSSLKGLEQVITGNTRPSIQKLRNEINSFSSKANRSISTIESQVSALRALRREADINSKEFRELTADIAKYDKQLGKAQGRRPNQGGGRALAATQIAGAAVSGGIFGGPEGFLGALGGGLVGGVPGAFAGAAFGAQAGMIRQSLGGVAETVAEINSMKIALAGVSESAEDYNTSFENVIDISKEFLFPVDKSIGEFTKLKAAVVGAGFGTEETTDVFKGFAAAILATGGNAEKLSGALLAASQVFSKGKVQAEELRGQIGERLPGAFTTFAQSIGVSSRDLDDMLRKGEVSTENFVEFTRTLFGRYERTAATLASAPEKAGQRLQLALSLATLEYGGFFQQVGAGFQDYMTKLVNFAVENKANFINIAANVAAFALQVGEDMRTAALNIITPFQLAFEYLGITIQDILDKFGLLYKATKVFGKVVLRMEGFDNPNFTMPDNGRQSFGERAAEIRKSLTEMFTPFQPTTGFATSLGDPPDLSTGGTDPGSGTSSGSKDISDDLLRKGRELNEARNSGNQFLIVTKQLAYDIQKIQESGAEPLRMQLDLDNARTTANLRLQKLLSGQPDQIKAVNNEMTEMARLSEQIRAALIDGISNGIMGLIDRTNSLRETFVGLLKQIGGMFLRAGVGSIFNDLFPKPEENANGNAYSKNGIVPFARGGVVTRPTLFPFAKGTGLMGEAGPEAIMPLRRGANGKLGVEASGGVGNVTVNVDASGSKVQSDNLGAAQLGKTIGAAVQAELIKQKRPGGLLN